MAQVSPTTSFSKSKKRQAQISAVYVSTPACEWAIKNGRDKVLFLPGPGDGLERNIKQKKKLGFTKTNLVPIELNKEIQDYLVEKYRNYGYTNPEKCVLKGDVFEYLTSLSDVELCKYGQLDIDIFTCFKEDYRVYIKRFLGLGVPSVWFTVDVRGGNSAYKEAAEKRLGFDLTNAEQETYIKPDMANLVKDYPYEFHMIKYAGNRTNNQGSTLFMLLFNKSIV